MMKYVASRSIRVRKNCMFSPRRPTNVARAGRPISASGARVQKFSKSVRPAPKNLHVRKARADRSLTRLNSPRKIVLLMARVQNP